MERQFSWRLFTYWLQKLNDTNFLLTLDKAIEHMNFEIENNTNYSVVSSHVDKLNAANAPDLKSAVITLNKNAVSNIIIDLSKTNYCDSSGLSAVLTANRLCKNSNGQFVLCGLQPNVAKMIQIAQLDRVLNIQEDLSKAVKELL